MIQLSHLLILRAWLLGCQLWKVGLYLNLANFVLLGSNFTLVRPRLYPMPDRINPPPWPCIKKRCTALMSQAGRGPGERHHRGAQAGWSQPVEQRRLCRHAALSFHLLLPSIRLSLVLSLELVLLPRVARDDLPWYDRHACTRFLIEII